MYKYMCVYAYIYICMYIYMYVFINVYIYMYIYIYVYLFIYTYMYVCIYICVCIFIYAHICGVMVKAMNCGIVVREFVLQSRYYVHFRANTLGKGMNPLILPPAMGK